MAVSRADHGSPHGPWIPFTATAGHVDPSLPPSSFPLRAGPFVPPVRSVPTP